MKIGVPVWKSRVSPVLDSARRLLVVEVKNELVVSKHETDIRGLSVGQKVRSISQTGLNLLICGAVSGGMVRHLQSHGVEVLPWIRGDVDLVIGAFCTDSLDSKGFALPGCSGNQGRKRRRRGKHSGDDKKFEISKEDD